MDRLQRQVHFGCLPTDQSHLRWDIVPVAIHGVLHDDVVHYDLVLLREHVNQTHVRFPRQHQQLRVSMVGHSHLPNSTDVNKLSICMSTRGQCDYRNQTSAGTLAVGCLGSDVCIVTDPSWESGKHQTLRSCERFFCCQTQCRIRDNQSLLVSKHHPP